MKYRQRKSNYCKRPVVEVQGDGEPLYQGWDAMGKQLAAYLIGSRKGRFTIAVDCYQGIDDCVADNIFKQVQPAKSYFQNDYFADQDTIRAMTYPDVTDDRLFGYLTRLTIKDFFSETRVSAIRREIAAIDEGVVLVYGAGASLIVEEIDLLIYLDMPRWEIQKKFKKNRADSLGLSDRDEGFEPHYKRGWFVDWRVLDRHKKAIYDRVDLFIDTVDSDSPVLIKGATLRRALSEAAMRPFQMVPYFDPGPWGGRWMEEVCDLEPVEGNYAWCINCVMEDQSLCLRYQDAEIEVPAANLLISSPERLLGNPVWGRFGADFPIRFDFLDTMEGGNLSLQVHPVTQYAQETFGIHYTQDESYYIVDAADDATVYLGVREGVEPREMIADLKRAEDKGERFDAEKYSNLWPAKKHDHFLIPGGTLHCSGANCLVLEISSNPYMFTFKLWDWGRLGLDGRPRPINIGHGEKNIQWNRDTEWVKNNLINRVERIREGAHWVEERTGLHELEFIETHRLWFREPVVCDTGGPDRGSCHVVMLIEGDAAVIESPDNRFTPIEIHYAEATIIPASVGTYRVRPADDMPGGDLALISAFVRTGLP